MKFEELSPAEQKIATELARDRGYRYGIKFECRHVNGTEWKDFGAPLYFKSADEVGPFMRSFTTEVLRQVWVVVLPKSLGKVAA